MTDAEILSRAIRDEPEYIGGGSAAGSVLRAEVLRLRAEVARLTLTWSTELPTMSGFCWWREGPGHRPRIWDIDHKEEAKRAEQRGGSLGQWAGPIVPPGGDAVENCPATPLVAAVECTGE